VDVSLEDDLSHLLGGVVVVVVVIAPSRVFIPDASNTASREEEDRGEEE
jgi:hypothetical protein